MPRCGSASRSSRSASPTERSRSTEDCSRMPARIRLATYSSERVSSTTDSMPSPASRWERRSPDGPAPMMATWVRMTGSLTGRVGDGSARASAGRKGSADAAGRDLEGADELGPVLERRHDDAQRGDDVGTAPDRHRDRAGAEAHLLGRRRVVVALHPGELATEQARLRDGVRRDARQVGEHRPLHLGGRVREQHLADAGGVQGQAGADAADDRHGGVPGEPVEVEDLGAVADGEVDGREGRAVQVVEVRRGQLAQPGLHRGEQAEVPQPPSDDVVAGRGPGQRAPGDELRDQAVRGRHRQSGPARELGERQPSVALVEGAEEGERARGDGRAGRRGVAGHADHCSTGRKRRVAAPSTAPYGGRVTETQAEISAEIAAISKEYDSAGVAETAVRRDYPPYRSSILRHPTKAAKQVDPEGLELWAPVFGQRDVDPLEADLTIQHSGEPLGERMVVTGRVTDGEGRPVRHQLVEIWQANGGGRYIHQRDQHPAPLDPNFTGMGRCLTDADGFYRFTTIKPGPYPWRNHRNAWRPAHIHFSVFGTEFTQRLVTQMYFPGDPLFALDPIYQAIVDPAARARLLATYDHDLTTPEWATGYRWDIVLTGSHRTPTEEDVEQ